MNKSKMIIFDNGHTLLHEPGFSSLRGEEAPFKYIKRNKNNLALKQKNDYSQRLFVKLVLSGK